MLAITDLTKRYGRRVVLDSVTAEVPGGVITALLGPNGAGKSTLLHAIVGLVPPDRGTVATTDASGSPTPSRTSIGFCPDDLPMAELLTGNEYLDLVKSIRGVRVSRPIQENLLSGMRLLDAMNALIGTYSHGMRRKLQVVAALVHTPSVLVLDEPLRGLDPESSSIMKTLLRRYADRGNAVLLSTHDLLAADQLADRVLVLSGGTLRADRAMSEMHGTADSESLESEFLRMTGLESEAATASEEFFAGLDALILERAGR